MRTPIPTVRHRYVFAVGRRRSCRVAESRAPACLRCVGCGGYARAALCGPLVASRPPGDLKTTTNPHCIALGPPPVSPSLHRASFQKSARGGRTPKRFYLSIYTVCLNCIEEALLSQLSLTVLPRAITVTAQARRHLFLSGHSALGIERTRFKIVFSRVRAPQNAQSWCLGRPPSTCAHDYVLVFLASAPKKTRKGRFCVKRVRTANS